ncbi:MAG: class II glutamine amidotransferase [Gammaproteobacteria bacterium]|nr:class II glutamine amidotransferase [Gammaproteobacteria bacterium]
MCELMGMSANVSTDICFSFAGLIKRGGETGPHKDGWGITFFEGKGVREFKDVDASATSEIARFVKDYPIKSHIVISHIRKANSGRVALENTHPFTREMWGLPWVYAHNGQLRGVKKLPLTYYRPVGTTDSEFAFCYILNKLRERFDRYPPRKNALFRAIHTLCEELRQYGVFNILFSDSKFLYCYCSTKLCHITRRSPFGVAHLRDKEVAVDFSDMAVANDVVTVIATAPLTTNEPWENLQTGELLVFQRGEVACRLLPKSVRSHASHG